MHFAPDTIASLDFAVAIGNTHASSTKSGEDELATIAHVRGFFTRYRYTGRIDNNLAELAEVRAARDRIRSIWNLTRDDAALEINNLLAEAKALPFLARHDDFDWHLHANSPDAPLAERVQSEIGLALVDVVRTDSMWRLRGCEAPDCDGIMADLSRNGSRRFCSIRCGNRMNQIAYRERQAADDA